MFSLSCVYGTFRYNDHKRGLFVDNKSNVKYPSQEKFITSGILTIKFLELF